SPGRVSTRNATWLAIVPDGSQRDASLPNNPATCCCRRFTVGASPYWSSPTGGAAIAARIASVRRVTVSERRSIGLGSVMALKESCDWRYDRKIPTGVPHEPRGQG